MYRYYEFLNYNGNVKKLLNPKKKLLELFFDD